MVTSKKAFFAGGCFWGVEHLFSQLPGVQNAVSGYSGGHLPNPTYQQVRTGDTGHAETVEVTYDPDKISYEELARFFFEVHDPTEWNRQGIDVGTQYRSVLFYGSENEKKIGQKLVAELKNNGYDVVTQIVPVEPFYAAEDYHQDYVLTHPAELCHFPVKRFDKPGK